MCFPCCQFEYIPGGSGKKPKAFEQPTGIQKCHACCKLRPELVFLHVCFFYAVRRRVCCDKCRELTADLSKATRGEAFVLMGGDCAESFSEFKVSREFWCIWSMFAGGGISCYPNLRNLRVRNACGTAVGVPYGILRDAWVTYINLCMLYIRPSGGNGPETSPGTGT